MTLDDLNDVVDHLVHHFHLPQPGQQRVRHHHRGNRYPGNEHRATPVGEFQVLGCLLALLLSTLPQLLLL